MKPDPEPMVLFDSPDAARLITVEGWVSRKSNFFGKDERMARWDGCTHIKCAADGCETLIERGGWTICDACRDKATDEKNAKRERREWKGEPVFHQASDKFYYDEDSLASAVDCEEVAAGDVFLFGEPEYPDFLSHDYFADAIPDDDELPADLEEAVDAFNAVIQARRDQKDPTCWNEGSVIAVIDPAVFEMNQTGATGDQNDKAEGEARG